MYDVQSAILNLHKARVIYIMNDVVATLNAYTIESVSCSGSNVIINVFQKTYIDCGVGCRGVINCHEDTEIVSSGPTCDLNITRHTDLDGFCENMYKTMGIDDFIYAHTTELTKKAGATTRITAPISTQMPNQMVTTMQTEKPAETTREVASMDEEIPPKSEGSKLIYKYAEVREQMF